MKKAIVFSIFALAALFSSACSQRYIMDVDDHPRGHATIMRTIDC